ncbi:MAG: DUF1801 domain-containing protein [Spirochaetales bacterium]|nr:DUF1801 domain-containing protein [Spirochaetales bacterium]
MDNDVKAYIENQPSPKKEICIKCRNIIYSVYPHIEEKMKYGVPYYGDKVYLLVLKTHVNMGFDIHELTQQEISCLKGSGKTARYIPLKSVKDVDTEMITRFLKLMFDR